MACIVFKLEDGSTINTPLDVDLLTLGRAEDSMVQLADPSVSSRHATIKAKPDGFYVQDLGSRNGTRLNDVVIEEALLKDGDRVAFGDVAAFFYSDKVPVLAAPVAPTPPPDVVVPLVTAAAPVAGIPRGAGQYNPKPRLPARPAARVNEGEGCMSFFVLCLLCFGAFAIGLCMRHYQQTERFLPNDLVSKMFSKVSRITIEMPEESKK